MSWSELIKTRFRCIAVTFILAFVPRIICTFFMKPVKILMDEICSLNSAAYFAGLNWSAVVSKGSYYGIGFYGLFAPLFKLTDNPYLIYHIILSVLAIMQASTAVICYIILEKIFNFIDYKWKILVSTTCSYMVVTRAVSFVNESILILLTWLIVWILLELEGSNSKRRFILTTVLFLVLSYALLIHTRAITFWIAVGFLVVLYILKYKKCLVSLPACLLVAVVCVPSINFIIGYYQKSIWNTTEVTNASINVSTKVFSLNNFISILDIVLGEINAIAVFTGGVAFLAICVCFYSLIISLFSKEEKKFDKYIFVIVVFCGVSIALSIGGVVSSWGTGVIEGILKEVTKDFYAYKAFTYLRYLGPYLGPLLLVVFIYISEKEKEIVSLAPISVLISLPIQLYWVNNIIPFIASNSNTQQAFMLYALWRDGDELGAYIYYCGIIFMINFMVIYSRVICKCSKYASVVPILIILLFQYCYAVYAIDIPWCEKNICQVESSYKIIKDVEEEATLPKCIYVNDNISNSHHTTGMIYQFMFNRYEIIPMQPEDDEGEILLFENTDENCADLMNREFLCLRLDENEYLYIKGERLQNIFKIRQTN